MSVLPTLSRRAVAARAAQVMVVSALVALTPTSASAATFTPAAVPDLVNAINVANSNGQADVIDLGGNTFTLATAAATNSGLPIITGDGGNGLTIQNGTIERSSAGGTPQFRILTIEAGNVTLDGVTLTNGSAGNGQGGGAISSTVNGVLTLTDSRVEGNAAAGDGGGVLSSGFLTLTGSTVSSNTAASDGGGVYVVGNVSVTSSAVDNNAATANGGGIYGRGLVSLIGSTVSANDAGAGGGVHVETGELALDNSTVSGNSAGGVRLDGGSFGSVKNSTVVNNSSAAAGANIFVDGLPGLDAVESTIIAAPQGGGANCNAEPAFGSFNLDSDGSCGFLNGVNDNQVGTIATPIDPLLAALANNGGATETHALLAGSPAIDAGANPLALAFDQRGTGFPRTTGPQTDIGAYELREDADSDAIPDGNDNCPVVANPDQADADADDIGDLCDACTDTDADGIGDPGFITSGCLSPSAQDNCPAVANPDQTDTDVDGFGDVCDPCPAGDNAPDADADGTADACDPCPKDDTNSCVDSDDDGLTDADETALGTNPNDPDTDDDGLKDGRERAYNTCLNLLRKDTDGDGIGDATELVGLTVNQYYTTNGGRPGTKYLIGKVRTNPCKSDSDGDGLSDYREAAGSVINQTIIRSKAAGGAYWLGTRKTNPVKRDTDADGLNDKVEITGSANWRYDRRNSDPTSADTDWGGNGDGREVLYHRSDPTRVGT